MQLSLNVEQQEFRDEVREFLSASLPRAVAEKVRCGRPVSKKETGAWTRTLNERGWAAPAWPQAHGGTGWSLVERHLFDVECRAHQAPVTAGFGFNMVGPAIIKYGTPEQQARFLPPILSADLWWCQGYSEPSAGSDLASLRTRAVRDGDEYVVNGSKIWTSAAEIADWIFALVRTDADSKPQRGISFLLIDLATPGIRIEPLYAFNGKRLWNQVFFDDVRVPVENRLGEENRGWTVAKSLLGDERLMVSRVTELLGEGCEPAMRTRLDALAIRLDALEMTSLRLLLDADRGGQIGAEPSMLKLKGSQLVQAFDELALEAVGYFGIPIDSSHLDDGGGPIGPERAEFVASRAFHHRGFTIAGGTSEVQHDIIAKQVLGL
jgi:alkylation response protein AidB-like acyl-CoA dehydrogenase